MRKLWFYPKVAGQNLGKNAKLYLPYLLACTGTVMMTYILSSLKDNVGLNTTFGGSILAVILALGVGVISIFAFILLFYTNSFLLKRRKKEFGLFNVLGMEKRHIGYILFFETLYAAVISLTLGIGGGVLLSKLIQLLLGKITGISTDFDFRFSFMAASGTAILFGVIFLATLLNALRQLHFSKPVELLHGGEIGEKEPKTKWFLTIVGVCCLCGGYYISITQKDPLSVLMLFFLAVILVIAGTYCLFTAGSIAFLKLMRKNKNYYYQTRHFISVSGMLYRMKQNAAGLANICILSTMVLVMLSSTGSLYLGMEGISRERYPRDVLLYDTRYDEESRAALTHTVESVLKREGASLQNEVSYRYLAVAALLTDDGFIFDVEDLIAQGEARQLYFIPLEDYNRLTGENETLGENEVLIWSNRTSYNGDTLTVAGERFQVKKIGSGDFVGIGFATANIASSHFIIVPDMAAVQRLDTIQRAAYGEHASMMEHYYAFDLNAPASDSAQLAQTVRNTLYEEGYEGRIELRQEEAEDFASLYGGLFFLGLFLGILFLMATVLIIYYKQVSEGYEDKRRYEIMQKVGMSRREVKKSIHSQILTVFFLPLVTAGIHTAFAFPAVSRLLSILGMVDVGAFALCNLACFVIFALIYVLVYSLTARAYYKIVS
ncbi:MAG: ABC transporter permease [Oscillospiraceae bacterium]|nr:ABC transporter permease [Oscillospiraceae bacterium]